MPSPPKSAADGTAPVYATEEHRYQVDRDLNAQQRRDIRREHRPQCAARSDYQVVYRGMQPGDFHFILNAWMQSYRIAQRDVKKDNYYTGQQNLIAEVAKRRTVIIAADAEMPEFIFGFICGQLFEDHRTLIDYLYVKKFYRERGVARGLLEALGFQAPAGAIVTHRTPCVEDAIRAHNLDYNPYYNCLGYSDV